MTNLPDRILFYDGECGFCARNVQEILRLDPKGLVYFAALQGETAKALLPDTLRQVDSLGTLVYARRSKESATHELFTRSAALEKILGDLNRLAVLRTALWVAPRVISDFIYNLVARNRTRISKLLKQSFCTLPQEGEEARFLP